MLQTSSSLIDLNDKCLQKIWNYLDVFDLVNMADAFDFNDRMISEKEKNISIYVCPLAVKHVKFARSVLDAFQQKNGPSFWFDTMSYKDTVSFGVKLLRHFGGIISNIFVDYTDACCHVMLNIDAAILKHCRNSLISIELSNIDESTFSKIWQPFPKVERLKLCDGFVSEKLSQLNKWFPNVRSLHLKGMEFDRSDCIETYFPHLEELIISNDIFVTNDSDFEKYNALINDANLKIVIHLNPQLTTLSLSDDVVGYEDYGIRLNKQLLFYIKRKLPNMHTLNLDFCFNGEDIRKPAHIMFEQLKSLGIYVGEWADLAKIPIASNQLERICLKIVEDEQNPSTVDLKNITNFLRNNRNVRELTVKSLHYEYDLYSASMIAMIHSLPKLTNFTIIFDWFGVMAIDAIIYFLKKCRTITNLILYTFNDRNVVNEEAFIQDFNGSALVNGFDSNVWELEFGETPGFMDQGIQSFVCFKKHVTEFVLNH